MVLLLSLIRRAEFTPTLGRVSDAVKRVAKCPSRLMPSIEIINKEVGILMKLMPLVILGRFREFV
jgi:hypothetical protein